MADTLLQAKLHIPLLQRGFIPHPYLKQSSLLLVLCYLLIANSGCGWTRSGNELPEGDGELMSATPTLDFSFEDSRTACQATSECILMQVGGCENVQAIHLSQVDVAEAYTARAKKEYANVQCAPDFPMEEYEALCLNQQCRAVLRDYRLLLEVPEQAVVGRPFWVGMSFRFHVSAEKVTARFVLPQDLEVVRGQTIWSGPVNALEDHVMWVEVLSNRAGKVYLSGWAGIKQGDTGVPPLIWGRYFTIESENSLTPRLMGTPILATPTYEP